MIIQDVLHSSDRLKSTAAQMLEAACSRGKISTCEIASFIPKDAVRNRDRLRTIVASLGQLMKTREVTLLCDTEERLHRQKYPLIKRVRPTLRSRVWQESTLPSGQEFESSNMHCSHTDSEVDADLNSLDRYLSEIRHMPLLSPVEELKLSKLVFEENDLGARDYLVKHNLRLVWWVANKYRWSQLDFEDLLQEGNIGLMIAAEKFDYRIGGRFSTYAVWWIRQAITRAIFNKADTIRIPVHMHEFRSKILKASGDVAAETGWLPSLEEVTTRTGISENRVRQALQTMKIKIVSLDDETLVERSKKARGENTVRLHESIPDEGVLSQDQILEAREELEAARKNVVDILVEVTERIQISERNKEVFKIFYGFDDSQTRRTLENTSKQFGLTRERIRQIIVDIWEQIDARGIDMDHDKLLSEFARIERLEVLIPSW